jgi:hypothetical protein
LCKLGGGNGMLRRARCSRHEPRLKTTAVQLGWPLIAEFWRQRALGERGGNQNSV